MVTECPTIIVTAPSASERILCFHEDNLFNDVSLLSFGIDTSIDKPKEDLPIKGGIG